MHRISALALSGLIAAAVGCVTSSNAKSLKPEKSRSAAPEFVLKDSEGKTVKLSDYKGKVVLLNFWATYCGPCKFEIPWFVDFEQKFKEKGFAVLGVAMDDEGWEVVKPYIATRKINYRILVGNEPIARLYGGLDALPTTLLLDRQGKIATTHVGLVSRDVYQNDIVQLLEGSASERADSRDKGAMVAAKW